MAEMGKSEAPTLFQVNGPVGLANWKDYCYDLSGSDIYTQLTSDDYALKEGDTVYGIAYVIESYGIITNKTLLEKAGYTLEDIQSFDRGSEESCRGYYLPQGRAGLCRASPPRAWTAASDWRFKTHLANLPVYFEYQDDGISTTDAIKGTISGQLQGHLGSVHQQQPPAPPPSCPPRPATTPATSSWPARPCSIQNGSWEYGNLTREAPSRTTTWP